MLRKMGCCDQTLANPCAVVNKPVDPDSGMPLLARIIATGHAVHDIMAFEVTKTGAIPSSSIGVGIFAAVFLDVKRILRDCVFQRSNLGGINDCFGSIFFWLCHGLLIALPRYYSM